MVLLRDQLRRNFVLLKDVYDNQETRLRYSETKLQNIVLGYLSWGRLFFFGVSLSFKCKDWWVVLALTLFSTFLYSLLFLDAVTVLSRTQDQLDVICKELTGICQQILVAQNQDDVGLSVETMPFCKGKGKSQLGPLLSDWYSSWLFMVTPNLGKI
ncbi:unnamed protein product [Citrullus colocynthis]|uniref:Uncharacterized protein n=1 Tax=Citrullus colocynthis TaxID=252529 RepID=A0ABP0XVM9_9ROSI